MTEKSRELDDKKSGEITYWREHFAEITNAALERAGHSARIDHRTLEAQGITDRVPTIHMGPAVTALERRGINTSHQDRAAAVVAAALAKASASVEREIKQVERPAPAQAQDLLLYRAHKLERELQQARDEAACARDELKSIMLQAPQHAPMPARSREQIELHVKIKIDSESMTLEQAQRERDRARAEFDNQEQKWKDQSFIKRGVGIGKSDLFDAARKLDAANSIVDRIESTLEQSPRAHAHIDKLVIEERQRYESERETWQQYEREKRRVVDLSKNVEHAEQRERDALHALNALSEGTNESFLQRQRGHEMSM